MKHLDLFSGIGGFALAARRVGWETVLFCENDEFCQRVLSKNWPTTLIIDNIEKFANGSIKTIRDVGIITAGYPCQPYSVAGKRGGEEDDRNLWLKFIQTVRSVRPRWIVCENVVGHITMGLDEVLLNLDGLGYTWESFIIPACALNAPHRRDRLWVVAYSYGERLEGHSIGIREKTEHAILSRENWWEAEPSMDRVDDGLPDRMDRIRSLGNAIVPQIAEVIFTIIKEIEWKSTT